MRLLFVVNPIAGGLDKEAFLAEASRLCHYYGIDYRFYKTTGKNDRERLIKAIRAFKPHKVAAVGGDGTILFTGTTLMDFKIPMGIIPMGSANGMAKELFVEEDPVEALKDVVLSNLVGHLDLICVNNEHYCLHLGDVGINAQIVNSFTKDSRRGMFTYARYLLEAIRNAERFEFSIHTHGQSMEGEAVMIAICNARKFGTGIPLNARGNPFDGKFELVIIHEIGPENLLATSLAKFSDTFLKNQDNDVLSADEFSINFKHPRLLQLDGEVIGEYSELSLKIIRGAISLLTHRGNQYLENGHASVMAYEPLRGN